LLSQGGFGAVYLAMDLKLHGPCAIKENLDTSPEAERQFEQEASILFNLKHPGLPRVFDFFSLSGKGSYLAMDFIEGDNLETLLEDEKKPLPEKKVLEWLQQICNALTYMHNQPLPIVHRDIKPANIKITPEGQAVLVDFGISKVYKKSQLTTLGAMAATPGYAPIEQYGRGRTDIRTDVYALGATAFTLLTNTVPPDSPDRFAGTPLPNPLDLNGQISLQVANAIIKALDIDPDRRFQSVVDFWDALGSPAAGTAQTVILSNKPSPKLTIKIPTQYIQPEPSPLKIQQAHYEPELVHIPAGTFLMGAEAYDNLADAHEKPQHTISLPEYYIGKYPVTNAEYQYFRKDTGKPSPAGWRNGKYPQNTNNHPVVEISWYDARDYCQWLAKKSNKRYRLPTEAEWEKAARGDKGFRYPWGNTFDPACCNSKNSPALARPSEGREILTTSVGTFSTLGGDSPYGCADMAGNVWEICSTKWDFEYPYSTTDGRDDLAGDDLGRVVRGGSWFDNEPEKWLRCTARIRINPWHKRIYWGFRCVLAV